MSDDIDRLIAALEAGLRGKPNYAYNRVGLAELAAQKKHRLKALEIARAAMAAGRDDPKALVRGRRLLQALVGGYHVPMMNDARRNAAWDSALRRAVKPGMHVFEIGSGAGMLALMAARAGAGKVVTCEKNDVAAAMARELIARNGYADRIEVIVKRSQDIAVGIDLERPADLLFCDIFADNLVGFDPLPAIADAKARLLAPGAPVLPAAAALRVALADWQHYGRVGHIDQACGFDLAAMNDFIPTSIAVPIGDPALRLLSQPAESLRFDFAAPSHPARGSGTVLCEADADGAANGIARWIRLELDGETVLQARPEPGAVFFSSLAFCPFEQKLPLRAGERLRIETAYDGKTLDTWLAGPA